MDNIYTQLLAIFIDPAKMMIENLATNAVNFFHIQAIFNGLIGILVMMWAYKHLKDGDLFEFKTAMKLMVFVAYCGFMNWAIKDTLTFIEYLQSVVFYPANWTMDLISQSISHIMLTPRTGTEPSSISFLIQTSYNALFLLYKSIFNDLSFTNFFKYLPQLFLFGFVIIAEVAFMALVMLIVLIVNIETYVWLAFGILFLPLILFPQTRAISFTYLKKLISLTLYQPALFLFAFFNFNLVFAIVKKIPTQAEIEQGFFGKAQDMLNSTLDGAGGYITIMGYFTTIIIGALICFFLVRRAPDFINNLFGTSGGIGGSAEMIQKMTILTAGATLGATAGFISGQTKDSYQKAGGGIGGAIAGMGSMMTGGLAGGIAGELGQKINDSKIGSKINEGISFGINSLKGKK